MSEARKLPSGKWRNQLYVGRDSNGKRVYESFTADTKKEADRLAAIRARELELGIQKAKNPTIMTVGEAIDSYIESNSATLKPKTIREYKGYRRRYLQGLMNIRIRDLTVPVAQAEINRDAKRLSPKSVHNAWGLVSVSVKAVTENWRLDVNLPAIVAHEMEIPSDEQLLEVLRHVEGQRLEIPVLIGATTGLRRGEIAALDLKKDVDFKNNRIRVHKSIQHDEDGNWFVIQGAKTASSTRWVECPPWLIEKIKALPDDYKIMSAPTITSRWRRVADAHGLFNIRFHDLRHYYASLLISVNCPNPYIIKRMGHSTPEMLRRVYGHIVSKTDQAVTEQVNQHFAGMQHSMQHETDFNAENRLDEAVSE